MKFDHLKKVGTLITPDYEYIDPSIPAYQISGESPKDVYQDGALLLVHDCIGLKNEGLYQVLPQDIEKIKACAMNCPKCQHHYFEGQAYCSNCGWVPLYVVTYDNGSGFREWASKPQETEEMAIALAGNGSNDFPRLEMTYGFTAIKVIREL
jgi:hypothetical protein